MHRIALKANVFGYVKNLGGSEVEIYIEGSRESIRKFFTFFWKEKPEVAIIESINVKKVEPKGFNEFKVLKSGTEITKRAIIPPDFSICEECLKEVLNPNDKRRYRYPFNSCAFCGPRYSMMYTIPWDRENTAMRDFPLCEECMREYTDVENIRRYHAEGISCSLCGPKVFLYTRDGELINVKDPIREAAKLINEGYIIAIKGIGGFHITCLASDDNVVLELRKRKRRPEKPFAIMVLDIETASKLVYLNDDIIKILKSIQRPILLLPAKEDAPVSKYIAPGLKHLGIFLPYTALHYLLLRDVKDKFAIMTSGNPHGEPMCISNETAFKKLKNIVDYFLIHNREIVNRVDDSVLRYTCGELVFIRRGRGFAPMWITVKSWFKKPVIAFGALLQNTGAIAFENKVILTQFIGDCDDFNTLIDLDRYLRTLINMYKINVKESILVCDLHPEYTTTKLAEEWSSEYGIPLIKVQHHWAHIVSTMADRGITEEVIGIAIDGIGYGIDRQIWGGEVMICTYSNFERIGHLKYVKIPGGDLAVEYPVRMLISYLSNFLTYNEIKKILNRKKLIERGLKYGEIEFNVIIRQIESSETSYTSSTGRFLDAVSTYLGVCYVRTYEGEPAIKLEAFAKECSDWIDIPIELVDGKYIINIVKAFEKILEIEDKYKPEEIAYMVQYGLGKAFGKLVLKIRKRHHRYVVMSGGAAVNEYIVRGVKDVVEKHGLKVILPKKVPPNDGGISLGQVIIANELVKQ